MTLIAKHPPRSTANPSPVRPAGSIRRTLTTDVSWPDGAQGKRLFEGRVRDYLTPVVGTSGKVCDQATFEAVLKDDKTIASISATPNHLNLEKLVGERGGGHLRLVLKELMPDLIEQGDPLYLALDDISGVALVSAVAMLTWYPDQIKQFREQMSSEEFEKQMADKANVCWGLQEGNSGLDPDRSIDSVADADAGELRNPDDLHGWHVFPEREGLGFRRARRIDIQLDKETGIIHIDSAFQDSAKTRAGGRVAIHEYQLSATVDYATKQLLTLDPEARILPFSECPGAIHNTKRLLGLKIDAIRGEVLSHLGGPRGCTHLNDALRALTDVPKLIDYL